MVNTHESGVVRSRHRSPANEHTPFCSSGVYYGRGYFFDPVNVRVCGVAGVMLDSDGVAHLVLEFFAAFHILFSEDLHERSKDRIICISDFDIQDNSIYNNRTAIYSDLFRINVVRCIII